MASEVTGYAVRFLTSMMDRDEYGWMQDPTDQYATGKIGERYLFRTKNGAKQEARKLIRLNPGCRYAVVTIKRGATTVPLPPPPGVDTTLLDRALELMRKERDEDCRRADSGINVSYTHMVADDVMIDIVKRIREEALVGR